MKQRLISLHKFENVIVFVTIIILLYLQGSIPNEFCFSPLQVLQQDQMQQFLKGKKMIFLLSHFFDYEM